MELFSGALRLTGLDDFLGPSQSCIKPVTTPAPTPSSTSQRIERDKTGLYEIDESTGKKQKLETATVSLEDCLACSGCVTSAESVLITQQSAEDFLSTLQTIKSSPTSSRKVVVTVSAQSLASLASHFNIDAISTLGRLRTFFTSLGADLVLSVTFARDLALREIAQEFVVRHRSATTRDPLLSSACPGWICYAEKAQGALLLPLLSTAKSPQQVMGTYVKTRLASLLNASDGVYHVSVMPCYDKKLEASREDFALDGVRDVDTVLTTSEILQMLKDKNQDFMNLGETGPSGVEKSEGVSGSGWQRTEDWEGSGGYIDYVFRYAALELFGVRFDGPLDMKPIRRGSMDMAETTLEVEGKTVLRFALAYGFKNIQNLVRKIKTGKLSYDFVEVMACPGGCLNGGGQIKNTESVKAKEKLAKVQAAYRTIVEKTPEDETKKMPHEKELLDRVYKEWILGQPYSENARKLLHTRYHDRSKSMPAGLNIKW
eukprot:TRINITY_DN7316_c0_g1_i1.p1 TRINITY_DN7316_c0_g1~~TRINITY_DN7316_c0_g1_i1.p1  ORF type:complete len:487 (+),score=95.69 TRINITY_DN7316_c0_g1_i1:48-1508(+)